MGKAKIIGIVIIVIIAGLIVNGFYLNSQPGEYDDFATCLTENDATMYGTSWCSHCNDQKARFGKSFKLVNFVDCDLDKNTCTIEGIKGYPTWKIKGEVLSGNRELYDLGEAAGCLDLLN